jgi:excisionase family DNA binding protein
MNHGRNMMKLRNTKMKGRIKRKSKIKIRKGTGLGGAGRNGRRIKIKMGRRKAPAECDRPGRRDIRPRGQLRKVPAPGSAPAGCDRDGRTPPKAGPPMDQGGRMVASGEGKDRRDACPTLPKTFFYPQEVARRLRVTEQHVLDLIDDGRLPGTNVGRRNRKFWRIACEDYERFVRVNTTEVADEGATGTKGTKGTKGAFWQGMAGA